MTWQAFLDTLLLALAGAVPLLAYWFKLWITERIAELKAASVANAGRLDQHDNLQKVITTPTSTVSAVLGRTSLPSELHEAADPLNVTPAILTAQSRIGISTKP